MDWDLLERNATKFWWCYYKLLGIKEIAFLLFYCGFLQHYLWLCNNNITQRNKIKPTVVKWRIFLVPLFVYIYIPGCVLTWGFFFIFSSYLIIFLYTRFFFHFQYFPLAFNSIWGYKLYICCLVFCWVWGEDKFYELNTQLICRSSCNVIIFPWRIK